MFAWTLGGNEILILLVLALILFGAKRLPELGRSLGQGMREFKKSISEVGDEVNKAGEDSSAAKK
jgi:sec-independent protein translocase protein TatA